MLVWTELNKDEKVAAIRRLWRPGIKTTEMAAHFEGANVNTLIALYYRNTDLRVDCPLVPANTHGGDRRSRKAGGKPSLRKAIAVSKVVKNTGVPVSAVPQLRTLRVSPGSFAARATPRTREAVLARFTKPAPDPKHLSKFLPADAAPVPLVDLDRHQCSFPVGADGKGSTLFCGAPKEKKSYCGAHAARAYASTEAST